MAASGFIHFTRLAVGMVAGGGMMIAGMTAFGAMWFAPGLILLAGGELVLLCYVVDECCVGAHPGVVLGLKLAAGAVFWLSAAFTAVQLCIYALGG